jgi:hypothetical protein
MRSLNTDGFTASLVGLAVMVIFLLLWGGWFFLVRIPLYESSQSAQLTGPQIVTAVFPAEALGDLQRGQPANFYPTGQVWEQYGAIPAVVTTVSKDGQAGQLQVKLALQPEEDLPVPLAEDVKGRVEIEVDRVTPASMALSSGGLGPAGSPAQLPGQGF